MTDRELVELLEQRFLGIASCGTCGICRQVAEMALASIDEHRQAKKREAAPAIDACIELDRIAGGARLEC